MPNYCYNHIEASEKVLQEIYDKKQEKVTFEKLIPMPKTLLVEERGNGLQIIVYALSKMESEERKYTLKNIMETNKTIGKNIEEYIKKNINTVNKFDEKNTSFDISDNEIELGIKDFKKLGETYISNILNYGQPSWYNWRIENWGTKWDAIDSVGEPKKGFLDFDTAWSPAEGIMKKLCEKFPNEYIDWYYEEPGMDFAGHFISDGMGGYVDNPCPVPNYSEEEEEKTEDV